MGLIKQTVPYVPKTDAGKRAWLHNPADRVRMLASRRDPFTNHSGFTTSGLGNRSCVEERALLHRRRTRQAIHL